MRHYIVQYGDSPATIASRFGIHLHRLLEANPTKLVVWVGGQRTWSSLQPGERVRVPVAGGPVYPPPPPAWPQQAVQPPQPQWPNQWQSQAWQPAQTQWSNPWQPQAWQPPPPPQPTWQRQEQHRHWERERARHGLRGAGDVAGVGNPWDRHVEELRRQQHRRDNYRFDELPYGVGDAGSDAVNALLLAPGTPCDAANASLVCAVQAALGLPVDGKWGAGTAKAAQAVAAGAPDGCTPRPSWWTPAGQSNCGPAHHAPIPSSPPASSPTVTMPPLVLPTAGMPAAPPPFAASPSAASSAPPAVVAMAAIDPCNATNVGTVCAAQAALGLPVDGKYGAGTARAVQAAVPGAPGPCSPRPRWWSPVGQTNCGGPSSGGQPAPAHGGGGVGPSFTESSVVPGLVAPKSGGNMMAVAGVLGALGLVGIVGVVAMGGHAPIVQRVTKYRTRRAPATAAKPTAKRAPAHPRAAAAHRRAPARRKPAPRRKK